MNPNHFNKLAGKYEKQSYFLLIVSTALILLPVMVFVATDQDKFIHRMTQAILEKGVVLGIISLLPFLIPGVILFLIGQIVLRRIWRKNPDTICKHCKTFLLNRHFWIRETGRCFHCGKKLFPVTDKENKETETDLVILEENQKLEISDLRKINSKYVRILLISLGMGTLLCFLWLPFILNIAPSKDDIFTSFLLLLSIGFFLGSLGLADLYIRKKLSFKCPNCNYNLYEKINQLFQFHRCPSCHVEVIKNPIGKETNKEPDKTSETRLIKTSDYIRLGNLHQKKVSLICLIPLGMSGCYFSSLAFWKPEPKDVTSYNIVFAMVLFSCFAFFYWLNSYSFKKKYNIVCPHCSKNLISAMTIDTVKSGNCYHCGRHVIEDD